MDQFEARQSLTSGKAIRHESWPESTWVKVVDGKLTSNSQPDGDGLYSVMTFWSMAPKDGEWMLAQQGAKP